MSRFDKYDPVSGGFRAPLNAAILAADVDKIQAVSINTSGKAVIGGAAETAVMGVICPTRAMAANEVIDVMTHGEIVEATITGGGAFTAGAIVYAHAAGTVDATATAGKIVAKMAELDRMIVRCPIATT
jgi:hypothetical protein